MLLMRATVVRTKSIYRFHPLPLLLLSVICYSCGVGFGEDSSDGGRQTEIPVEFSEATANVSFDSDNRLILVNLTSRSERQGSLVQRFPCSRITIEDEFLVFDLTQQGQTLFLNDQQLSRKSELDDRVIVSGVDSRLFAVWAFPEIVRGDIREQITITISDRSIKYRNDCRQA